MPLHYSDANGGCGLPGVEKSPGESPRNSRNELPEIILSRTGLNKGKGIMVIFRMLKHGENGSIRTGSTK